MRRDRAVGISDAAVGDGKPVEAYAVARRSIKGGKQQAKTDIVVATDARVAALLKALRADPELAPAVDAYGKQVGESGRKFGKNGLKTEGGKLFALFTQGTLVVKLPSERVATLVAQGVGKPFDPGHGRLMKGWLTVTSAKASWTELTKEAYVLVKGSKGS